MPPKSATIEKTKGALSWDEETAGVCTSAMYLRYSWGHAGRAGGNRTPNLRFWRPPLCQLSYCPVHALRATINGVDATPSYKVKTQAITLATTPAPTVLPPSRMAKRRPCSIAIGAISSTTILMLSPGITIVVELIAP